LYRYNAARCFVCDAWSCGECQLIRGDGEVGLYKLNSVQFTHSLKPPGFNS
jgi:hypothetical protein